MRSWSDCGGDVEKRFTQDEILAHVSVYWFNANIASTFRMYYESMGPFNQDRAVVSGKRVEVSMWSHGLGTLHIVYGAREMLQR